MTVNLPWLFPCAGHMRAGLKVKLMLLCHHRCPVGQGAPRAGGLEMATDNLTVAKDME